MAHAHLNALEEKHRKLDERIRKESTRAARDDLEITRMKKERLCLQEEIEKINHPH